MAVFWHAGFRKCPQAPRGILQSGSGRMLISSLAEVGSSPLVWFMCSCYTGPPIMALGGCQLDATWNSLPACPQTIPYDKCSKSRGAEVSDPMISCSLWQWSSSGTRKRREDERACQGEQQGLQQCACKSTRPRVASTTR